MHIKILSMLPRFGRIVIGAHNGFVRRLSVASNADADSLINTEYHFNKSVARILLNAPKKRNALSKEMMDSLYKELEMLNGEHEVRAVILAASGRVFSSGHDLKQLQSSEGTDKHKQKFARATKLMTFIQQMDLPVIAEVSGIATAAGCQLVASCDIVVAGKSSRFSVPGVLLGMFCSTPGVALARAVPRKTALDMLLTGDMIDAEQAYRAGLVSRLVDDTEVQREALNVAQKIASLSRAIVAIGKKFFYIQAELPTVDAYRMAERVMVDNLRLYDAQEGIAAFMERRKPKWSNTEKRAY